MPRSLLQRIHDARLNAAGLRNHAQSAMLGLVQEALDSDHLLVGEKTACVALLGAAAQDSDPWEQVRLLSEQAEQAKLWGNHHAYSLLTRAADVLGRWITDAQLVRTGRATR